MIWLESNWRVLVAGALILISVGLAKLANVYHERAIRAENSIGSVEAITKNATAAINLMYDISKAAYASKQEQQQQGQKQLVYIRDTVKGDGCAVRDVPAAAAYSLRMYADGLRSGAAAKDKS